MLLEADLSHLSEFDRLKMYNAMQGTSYVRLLEELTQRMVQEYKDQIINSTPVTRMDVYNLALAQGKLKAFEELDFRITSWKDELENEIAKETDKIRRQQKQGRTTGR